MFIICNLYGSSNNFVFSSAILPEDSVACEHRRSKKIRWILMLHHQHIWNLFNTFTFICAMKPTDRSSLKSSNDTCFWISQEIAHFQAQFCAIFKHRKEARKNLHQSSNLVRKILCNYRYFHVIYVSICAVFIHKWQQQPAQIVHLFTFADKKSGERLEIINGHSDVVGFGCMVWYMVWMRVPSFRFLQTAHGIQCNKRSFILVELFSHSKRSSWLKEISIKS